MTVYEAGLKTGSQTGDTAVTADGTLEITALDGVDSITIDGVKVVSGGALTETLTVATDEGELLVTAFDGATLSYTYTLNQNTLEHGDENDGKNTFSHELGVTVTDADGDEATGSIVVNIVDDKPSIESFEHSIEEGATEAIEGNALTGAVAGADGATFAWTADQAGTYGTVTLNEDGTYSYVLDNNNADVKALTGAEGETPLTENFTYTYTDADGDIATGSVKITITGVDNEIVITDDNGDEAGNSSVENPRDCGAWWAAIYGVAQGRPQLNHLAAAAAVHRYQRG